MAGFGAAFLCLALSLALPGAARADWKGTIYIWGDSNVNTYDGTRSLQHQLQRRLPKANIKVCARGLWTLSGPPPHFKAVFPVDWIAGDLFVVQLGLNDFATHPPLEPFRAAYRDVLRDHKQRYTVICMTPIAQRNENATNRLGLRLEDYRRAIRAECNAAGASVIEGTDAFPSHPRYFKDHVHPNEAGTRRMAVWLKKELVRLGWASE